jgi:hypothetical protein
MRKGEPLHRQPQQQPHSGAHRQPSLTPQQTGGAPSAPAGNSQKPQANDSTKQPGQRPQANKLEKHPAKIAPPNLPQGSKMKDYGNQVQNIEIVTVDIATLVREE